MNVSISYFRFGRDYIHFMQNGFYTLTADLLRSCIRQQDIGLITLEQTLCGGAVFAFLHQVVEPDTRNRENSGAKKTKLQFAHAASLLSASRRAS
jgi:hypothetical protein